MKKLKVEKRLSRCKAYANTTDATWMDAAMEEICASWLAHREILEDLLDTLAMHSLSEKDDHGDYALVNRGEMDQAVDRARALIEKEGKG